MRLCVCFNLSSSCDIDEPGRGSAPLSFLGSQLIPLFPLIVVSFSPSVFYFAVAVVFMVIHYEKKQMTVTAIHAS